jgi:hypothetical protein
MAYLGPLTRSIWDERAWFLDSGYRSNLYKVEPGYYSQGTITNGIDHDYYELRTEPGYTYTVYLTSDANNYGWYSYLSDSTLKFDVTTALGILQGSSNPDYSVDNVTDYFVLTPNTTGTYYIDVYSASFYNSDYALTVFKNLISNTPAIFFTPVYLSSSGVLTPSSTITADVSYYDPNNNSDGVIYISWYLRDGNQDVYLGSTPNNMVVIEEDWVGKTLLFSKSFFDDLDFYEASQKYVIGEILPSEISGPELISISPPDGSTNIGLDTTFTLTFDTPIQLGSGNIEIHLTSPQGLLLQSINANDQTRVHVSGNQLSLDMQGLLLLSGTHYSISLTPGLIQDLSGNSAPSIVDFNFITDTPSGAVKGEYFNQTGDLLIDSLTSGFRWDLDESRILDVAYAGGSNSEQWLVDIGPYLFNAISTYSYYADISFNYLGYYDNPTFAYESGSEITLSLDGASRYVPSTAWAIAYFPDESYNDADWLNYKYPGLAGDLFLNVNSSAVSLPSYDPGSQGWFLFLHEIGHVLGLKHPHDSGGTGRPTFSSVGMETYDIDWASVMSYNDDYEYNWVSMDPATPMLFDVLAMQYLYGPNLSTNATDSFYQLTDEALYQTLWDAGGRDLISASLLSEGFFISLPEDAPSALVGTRVGLAIARSQLESSADPQNLTWLLGDYEDLKGSRYDDFLTGNSLDNFIEGDAGDDYIFGLNGNDWLAEDSGSDVIDGGEGEDTYLMHSELRYYEILFDQGSSEFIVKHSNTTEFVDRITNVEYLSFDGISYSSNLFVDNSPPSVIDFFPDDEQDFIGIDTDVVVIFDKEIMLGTGYIEIRQGSASGNVVERIDVTTSDRLVVNGTILTVSPDAAFVHDTEYFIYFERGSIKDFSGNSFLSEDTYSFITSSAIDATPPSLEVFTGVIHGVNGQIELLFSEPIAFNAGTIRIRSAASALIYEGMVEAQGGSGLTIVDASLLISPSEVGVSLSEESFYTVEIDGAIADLSGNLFQGSPYLFSVQDITPPRIDSTTNLVSDVSVELISINFDEPIQFGLEGKIEIFRASDNSVIESFDINADSELLSVFDTILTLHTRSNLENETAYFVSFSGNAVIDLSNNSVDSQSIFNFETERPNTVRGQSELGVLRSKVNNGVAQDTIFLPGAADEVIVSGKGSDRFEYVNRNFIPKEGGARSFGQDVIIDFSGPGSDVENRDLLLIEGIEVRSPFFAANRVTMGDNFPYSSLHLTWMEDVDTPSGEVYLYRQYDPTTGRFRIEDIDLGGTTYSLGVTEAIRDSNGHLGSVYISDAHKTILVGITGGTEPDIFRISPNSIGSQSPNDNELYIWGFDPGDKIDLSGSGLNPITANDLQPDGYGGTVIHATGPYEKSLNIYIDAEGLGVSDFQIELLVIGIGGNP